VRFVYGKLVSGGGFAVLMNVEVVRRGVVVRSWWCFVVVLIGLFVRSGFRSLWLR